MGAGVFEGVVIYSVMFNGAFSALLVVNLNVIVEDQRAHLHFFATNSETRNTIMCFLCN